MLEQFLSGMLPFIVLLGIFYFLIIRPQMMQQKKRKEMLSSIKVGDYIRTIGAIYGTVEQVNEDDMLVRVDENVRLKVAVYGVEAVVNEKK